MCLCAGGLAASSDLGKRKNRWEDDQQGGSGGPGCKKRLAFMLRYVFVQNVVNLIGIVAAVCSVV